MNNKKTNLLTKNTFLIFIIFIILFIACLLKEKAYAANEFNILVAGDSIGISSQASDRRYTWTNRLEEHISKEYGYKVRIDNISMRGNVSYSEYVRLMSIDNDVDYDVVVICTGENDSEDDFGIYYEALLRAAMNKYSNALIVSVLESSQPKHSNKIRQIKKLCKYYNIPMADMIRAFDKSGKKYSELSNDGIHPNDEGYEIYYNELRKVIEKNYGNDNINREASPMYDEVNAFKNMSYYNKKQLLYDGNCTYSCVLSEENCVIGMDISNSKANQSFELCNEGKATEECKCAKTINESIMPVCFDFDSDGIVNINFKSKTDAEGLQGLIISNATFLGENRASFLQTPALKSVVNKKEGICIRWEKVDDANKYIILRKEKGSLTFRKIHTKTNTKQCKYTDKNVEIGKVYIYTVKAVREGLISGYEPGLEIKRVHLDIMEPLEFNPANSNIKCRETKNSNIIKLNQKELDIGKSYYLYRKELEGSWKKFKRISKEKCYYIDRSNNHFLYMIKQV